MQKPPYWIYTLNPNLTLQERLYIARTIIAVSRKENLDPILAVALFTAESSFYTRAVSPAGAMGLGQFMPGTAAGLGVTDAYDPGQNIRGSIGYLANQMRRWQGYGDQVERSLASYNAGPGAVMKYNGIPPYNETINYVRVVRKYYNELSQEIRSRKAVSMNRY